MFNKKLNKLTTESFCNLLGTRDDKLSEKSYNINGKIFDLKFDIKRFLEEDDVFSLDITEADENNYTLKKPQKLC